MGYLEKRVSDPAGSMRLVRVPPTDAVPARGIVGGGYVATRFLRALASTSPFAGKRSSSVMIAPPSPQREAASVVHQI
jgi:hypothetical protein